MGILVQLDHGLCLTFFIPTKYVVPTIPHVVATYKVSNFDYVYIIVSTRIHRVRVGLWRIHVAARDVYYNRHVII